MALDAKDGTKAVLRLKRVSWPKEKKRKMDLKGSCECLCKLVFFFFVVHRTIFDSTNV